MDSVLNFLYCPALCKLYFTLHIVYHSINPASYMAYRKCWGWIILVLGNHKQTNKTLLVVVKSVWHRFKAIISRIDLSRYRLELWSFLGSGGGAGEERRRFEREAETVTVSSHRVLSLVAEC